MHQPTPIRSRDALDHGLDRGLDRGVEWKHALVSADPYLLANANVSDPESVAISLIRRGCLRELLPLLGLVSSSGGDDPWLQLLRIEAKIAVSESCWSELKALSHSFEIGSADPRLRLWLRSLMVEHMVFHGSVDSISHAQLHDADRELDSPIAALSRGRIRRVQALSAMVLFGDTDHGQDLYKASLDEFRAIGLDEEYVFTQGILAFGLALYVPEGAEYWLPFLRGICDDLIATRSDRAAFALVCATGIAQLAEDHETTSEFVARLRGLEFAHPSYVVLAEFFGLVARLVCEGVDPSLKRSLHRAVDEIRDRFPQPWVLVTEAHLLLDYGITEGAAATARLADAHPVVTRHTRDGLDFLRARLEFVDTRDGAACHRLDELVGEHFASGNSETGVLFALRAAVDCRRLGFETEAENFLTCACGASGSEPRSRREARLMAMASGSDEAHVVEAGRIEVLAPRVRVARAGKPVDLGDLGSRLIVLLAAERRPVPAETAACELWPDLDFATARKRLNVLVHRVRRALGSSADELIVREAGGLSLDSRSWRVDLWDFKDLAASRSGEQRASAFEIYGANIADCQFALDETLIEYREDAKIQWCDLAVGMLRDGLVSKTEVAARAGRFGIDYPRLAEALAA